MEKIIVLIDAGFLSKLNKYFGEKWGRGLKFILEKEKAASFEDVAETFIATFKRKDYGMGERVGEKVGEKLTENQELIIKFVNANNHISIRELSAKVGIAEKNIENNLAKLKEKGLIKRVGPDKGGHWEVL